VDNVEDFAEVEARVFESAVDMLAVGFDKACILVNDNLDIVTGFLVGCGVPGELCVYVTKIVGQFEADGGGNTTDEDALGNKITTLLVGINPKLGGGLVEGCLDMNTAISTL
jgi:hypothetical protein